MSATKTPCYKNILSEMYWGQANEGDTRFRVITFWQGVIKEMSVYLFCLNWAPLVVIKCCYYLTLLSSAEERRGRQIRSDTWIPAGDESGFCKLAGLISISTFQFHFSLVRNQSFYFSHRFLFPRAELFPFFFAIILCSLHMNAGKMGCLYKGHQNLF